jgi:hypothetical protein
VLQEWSSSVCRCGAESWAYMQHWNGAGWPGMVSPEEQRGRV